MKSQVLEGLLILFWLNLTYGLPAKLLRVPKIYNALITTKEKLLPSEAYPASTGPVFQPIDFAPGEPILLNPEAFAKRGPAPEDEGPLAPSPEARPFAPSSETKEERERPAPLTFYPRYGLYYPHPYPGLLQQQFFFTSVGSDPSNVEPSERESSISQRPEPIDRDSTTSSDSEIDPSNLPSGEERTYVKNNAPKDVGVPDVPPPPPPVAPSKSSD